MGGDGIAISGAPSTALLEELNQKKAQIAALESQLLSSQKSCREVESKLVNSQGFLATAEAKIKELEALLAQTRTSGGGDAAIQAELKMVSKERDEFRDRLKEFEIIADDLANLKRLQQENEQLKKSLGMQGVETISVVQEEVDVPLAQADVTDPFEELSKAELDKNDNSALEEFLSEPVAPDQEPIQASVEAPVDEKKSKSDKTPEDLLSEFEKMLG